MSVAGKAVGDTTAARAFQPVAQTNPTTGAPAGSAATTDGSTPIAGNNGTSVATQNNPLPTVAEMQFNTTRPTIANGGYAPIQGTNRGGIHVCIGDTSISTAAVLAGSVDGLAAGTQGLVGIGFNFVYDPVAGSWPRQRGDSLGTYSISTPGSAAANAIAPVASTGATSALLKSSAGNFYSASMIAGATAGFFILYNSASVPAGGAALTAAAVLLAVPVAANGYATLGGDAIPKRCTSGIVLLFSTSVTTYTVPANAAIHLSGSAL